MYVLPLVVTGLALLVALAWLIGRVEANARNGAWQRIADARRVLDDRERRLRACVESPRCPDCPAQRPDGPGGG